jgi:hypothetical protein
MLRFVVQRMQGRKRWHALMIGLVAAGCRYGYDFLPPTDGQPGAGAAGEAYGAAGSSGTSDGGASSAGAPNTPAAGAGASDSEIGGGGDSSGISGSATTGGVVGSGGTDSAGTSGSGGTDSAGTSGSGGDGGSSSAGTSGTSGSGGSGGSSSAGTSGWGGSGGSGGSGTPPDLALCNQGMYGGHTYLLCKELRSWADANSGCQAAGMRLVRVDDATENQWLFDNANTPGGVDSLVWLGATDAAVEGEWRWNDGDLFWLGDSAGSAQGGLFDDWYFREPNNVGSGENCASLELKSATPDWFDSGCWLAKPYVCESL